jgi:hypothetical protein
MQLKEFKILTIIIKELESKSYVAHNNNIQKYLELESIINEKIKELESNCLIINIKYNIGSRDYYDKVFKVGTKLFNYRSFESMTQANGYYNIKIIDKITNQMKHSMEADSYYY